MWLIWFAHRTTRNLLASSSHTMKSISRPRTSRSRVGTGVPQISKVYIVNLLARSARLTLSLGDDLAFLVSNKTAFELPMKFVANTNIAGKTEVSIEFAPSTGTTTTKDGKKPRASDELVEMRFYVPGVVEKTADSDGEDKPKKSDDEDEEQSAAQVFHDAIRERADIGQGIIGESIVSFDDVLVVTPRGRYDIDLYQDSLRLRGKTYDYKVLYSQIDRLFILPKGEDSHVQFIVSHTPLHLRCFNSHSHRSASTHRFVRARPSIRTSSLCSSAVMRWRSS